MLSTVLSSNQIFGLIGFGGALWAAAALMIRLMPEILFGNQTRQIMSYLGIVPVVYAGFIRPTEIMLGISPSARLRSVAIMSASGLLLDGIAMMWFPYIYENPELMKRNHSSALVFSRRGAGWIFWGLGVGFVIALIT